jgi:hypothetical protein
VPAGYNRQLGIPDQYFAMGDGLILTVLGQLAFMPLLVRLLSPQDFTTRVTGRHV